jgi:hypothetical protein
MGYFVLASNSSGSGNRSGLSGADGVCLNELTTYSWLGKNDAGSLTSSRVKAFMCDGTTCNNLLPNTTYAFAATSSTAGGTTFTTNGSGQGPGDISAWSSAAYFGANVGAQSGRAAGTDANFWPLVGNGKHCNNWSSGQSTVEYTFGGTGESGVKRWESALAAKCNTNNRIICFVNP